MTQPQVNQLTTPVVPFMMIKRGEKAYGRELTVLRRGIKEMILKGAHPYLTIAISPLNKLDDLNYDTFRGPIRVEVLEEHPREAPDLYKGFLYEELGAVLIILD